MDAALSSDDMESAGSRGGLGESLQIRRRLTSEQAAARSLLIRRLRIILPILALLLVGVLLLNTRSTDGDNAFLDDFSNLEASPEELRMASPRFAGVDDKGYPYEITAEAALQAPGKQEVVELVKPRALTQSKNEQTVVHADAGVYQSDVNVLTLTGGVTLEHDISGDVYTLRTDKAIVSINEETVHAPGAIEGEGAAGALRADSMRAYNNEGRVVFEGDVNMRIYPAKAQAAGEAKSKTEGDLEQP